MNNSDDFTGKVASDVEAIESNKEVMYSINDLTALSSRYMSNSFIKAWGFTVFARSASEIANLSYVRSNDKIAILLSKMKNEMALLWAIQCVRRSLCNIEEVGADLSVCFGQTLWALQSSITNGELDSVLAKFQRQCVRDRNRERVEEISNVEGAVEDLILAVLRLYGVVEPEGVAAAESIVEMAEDAVALAMFGPGEEEWQLGLLVKMAGGQV